MKTVSWSYYLFRFKMEQHWSSGWKGPARLTSEEQEPPSAASGRKQHPQWHTESSRYLNSCSLNNSLLTLYHHESSDHPVFTNICFVCFLSQGSRVLKQMKFANRFLFLSFDSFRADHRTQLREAVHSERKPQQNSGPQQRDSITKGGERSTGNLQMMKKSWYLSRWS